MGDNSGMAEPLTALLIQQAIDRAPSIWRWVGSRIATKDKKKRAYFEAKFREFLQDCKVIAGRSTGAELDAKLENRLEKLKDELREAGLTPIEIAQFSMKAEKLLKGLVASPTQAIRLAVDESRLQVERMEAAVRDMEAKLEDAGRQIEVLRDELRLQRTQLALQLLVILGVLVLGIATLIAVIVTRR
jgi:hypothetical protein